MKTAHDIATEAQKKRAREKKREYYYEHREEILAKMKDKYLNDAEFRRRKSEYRKEQYLRSKFKRFIKNETT